jgi:predicted permease
MFTFNKSRVTAARRRGREGEGELRPEELTMLSGWIQDMRFAVRSLAKSPMFTAIAISSLALGIGANTAIFSLLDQLLLRMLPVREPQQLVQLYARGSHYGSNWGSFAMSYPMYKDIRDKATVFDGVIARRDFQTSVGYSGQTEVALAELVTGNYFQLLGVGAAMGRTIQPDDDLKPGAHPVAMLSYDYWKSRFASNPAVLNQKIIVSNQPFTVIGIAPAEFHGTKVGEAPQIFVPIMMQGVIVNGPKDLLENRRTRFLNVFGRLKPGVSVDQASSALQPLYQQIVQAEVQEPAFAKASQEEKDRFLKSSLKVVPGGTGTSDIRRQFQPAVIVLMSLVGVVLLIACANLANLQLARATARQKEMAVRLSVGASRWQIVRQLLIESVVLAVIAGAVGLAIGRVSLQLLLGMMAQETPVTITPSLDLRMLLFNFGVSLLVGLLFGIVPAWQSTRPDLATTLKDQAGAVVGGTHARFRKSLVVAQVTMALMLLVGAGLFVNSLRNLQTLNPGFRTAKLLMFSVDPMSLGYDKERSNAFYKRLNSELEALPGVESVAHSNMPLVSGDEWDSSITVEGQDPSRDSKQWAFQNHVSPGYFKTLGVEFIAGRDFEEADRKKGPLVTIVNERFVKEYLAGKDPIGRMVGMGSDPGTKTDMKIVGVVRDFKYQDMKETVGRQMYRPYEQMEFPLGMTFYVRTSAEPEPLFTSIRGAIRNLDSNLPVVGMRTINRQIERNLLLERMVAILSACFGALATLLAMLGLYGVMAYLVTRRSREIGIRMALGAEQSSVIKMIMREVLLLVAIGVVIGLTGSLGLTQFVKAQLFGITPTDPIVLGVATALLAVVALLAGFLPARRAAGLDPLRVLRYE